LEPDRDTIIVQCVEGFVTDNELFHEGNNMASCLNVFYMLTFVENKCHAYNFIDKLSM